MPVDRTRLLALGWTASREDDFAAHDAPDLVPARVAVRHRGAYEIVAPDGDRWAELAGHVRHTTHPADLPVVGDWVVARPLPEERRATVVALLPRRTRLARKDPDPRLDEQVLAANVDVVFVCSAVDAERRALPVANLRRVERYLAMVAASGAAAVLLVTKSDLAPDPARELAALAPLGAMTLAVSALALDGLDAVRAIAGPGRTAVFLGSSGVGKSTLVNALLGEERLATREIRDGGAGRHASVRRELVLLPGGGCVIDTPGLREVELWGAGLDETFPEVEDVAARCRFPDCRHGSEPGCAVRAALDSGELDPGRWESYRRLEREIRYLERKHDKEAGAAARRERKRAARARRS